MNTPSSKEIYLFFLKLGFISFGGPAGQIAIMHDFLVEKKQWMSNERFAHALNYCMLLPGPEAHQLATYMGWIFRGMWGGFVAGILFLLPSLLILWALSLSYVLYGNTAAFVSLLYGLKASIVGLILLALYKIGKTTLRTSFLIAVAGTSFVLLFFLHIPFPFVIAGAILLGVSRTFLNRGESRQLLKTLHKRDFLRVTKLLMGFLLLWFIPFFLIQIFAAKFSFWQTLVLFFTKTSLLTFGGAYAILPYVAQTTVVDLQWLSKNQMIDGLALGETTPGPLIMILSFIGFIAAYHAGDLSLLAGSAGLLVTTYYTFLPSFFFIFAGAPIVEKTQEDPSFRKILSTVSATTLAMILTLAIYLANLVIFTDNTQAFAVDWLALLWIFFTLLALGYFKVNIIYWILISITLGPAIAWVAS